MQLQPLVDRVDAALRYRDYPDFIIDILQEVDAHALERYERPYLAKAGGLMLRHGDTVGALYTAVFPSDDLIAHCAERRISDALLIVKHPMDWDDLGVGFIPISPTLLDELRRRGISLYCAHAAHDNFERCSPSAELAKALNLTMVEALRDQRGRIFGYLAESGRALPYQDFRSLAGSVFGLSKLQERQAREHVRRVAVISGGGDNGDWLRIARERGCDTYLTGILHFRGSRYAREHNPSFIEALKASELNALGLSHYFSEQGGSIALAQVLGTSLGLPAAFLPEEHKAQAIRDSWGMHL